MLNNDKKESIGNVTLDYSFYDENIRYSDGDDIENFILNIFREEKDVLDVLASDNRWPVLYHLSPMRENIIMPMDLNKDDVILEIGSGMGAITAPLSLKVKQVDCVEISKTRSLTNAYRNKDKKNITIYVGSFEKIQFIINYDVIVLIGVLEYAGLYINSSEPYSDFLKKLSTLLKPGGKLYIAIENRLGLKYLAGSPEDHWGKPFFGIEGYNTDEKGAKTFSKSELEQLLLNSGYSDIYFYYPVPDYKLPKLIYSDDYLPKASDEISANIVYEYDNPQRSFDEKKVFNTLKNSIEFKYLCNSFLVEVIKN